MRFKKNKQKEGNNELNKTENFKNRENNETKSQFSEETNTKID